MKTFNQHLLLAAAMLTAGVANAQSQVSTAPNTTRHTAFVPLAPNPSFQNATVNGAGAGTPQAAYGSYSQDSRVEQTGTHNYSTVDQHDGRGGLLGGSSAVITQTGDNNNASQTQDLTTSSNVAGGRNAMLATQAGAQSQSDQSQTGGDHTMAEVSQQAGSSNNRAIQTQLEGSDKSAYISQTNTSSGNRAEQSQVGGLMTTVITQSGTNSYALQTQSGSSSYGNDAGINQGQGTSNTAIQTQDGSYLNAAIDQSATGAGSISNNYAKQAQTGYSNNATIGQHSSGNYAEQVQGDNTAVYQNNTSAILQSNVASAAYNIQTGFQNTATITQH
jgi:hypothetical protein